MKRARNDKLVMIGDSITDCDRKKPVGEGHGDTLGRGYVSMVDALLVATEGLAPGRGTRHHRVGR